MGCKAGADGPHRQNTITYFDSPWLSPLHKSTSTLWVNPSARSTRSFTSTPRLQARASTGDRNSPGAWSRYHSLQLLWRNTLTYANLGGHLPAVQLLHRYDELGGAVAHDAVWFNLHEPLKAYLEMSLRVDQKARNGKSTLHLLAEDGNCRTMQIFLDFAQNGLEGLNVDDTDDRGRTAMDYMECRRDGEGVEVSRLFQLVLQRVRETSHCSDEIGDNEVFWDAVESQS
jgi:hypothetical protein